MMKMMSKEMMHEAMHAKSTDALKTMMTQSATALDDSELASITGGAGGSNKVGVGTVVYFIKKNPTLYETGRISAVMVPGVTYQVSATELSLDPSRFPMYILDSEIYLYSNDM